MIDKAQALRALGFQIGARDPNLNRAFKGKFMVAEARNPEDPYPTDDAGDGVFCIVGDNLDYLIDQAFNYHRDWFINSFGEFGPEGWAVFNRGTSNMRIEKIDELDVWPDDQEVWDHVAGQALAGSEAHLLALREIYQNNREEWTYFRRHWGASLSSMIEEKLAA